MAGTRRQVAAAARWALFAATAVALLVCTPAAACTLSSTDWTYTGTANNYISVEEYLSFSAAGTYSRSLKTSYITNCQYPGSYYISSGSYTATTGVVVLTQTNCTTPNGPSCVSCPLDGEATYSYTINSACSLLTVEFNGARVYTAVTPGTPPLSAGAVVAIVLAVLAVVGAAIAGYVYYTRTVRRGYWSTSNIQSEREPLTKF